MQRKRNLDGRGKVFYLFFFLFIINPQPLGRRDFGKITNPGELEDVQAKIKGEAKLRVSASLRERNQTMISHKMVALSER